MEAARSSRSATARRDALVEVERACEEVVIDLPSALRDDPNPGALQAILHALYDVAWLTAGLFGFPWLIFKNARVPGFAAGVYARMGHGLEPLPDTEKPRVLVHGVSVGEVKAAHAVVKAIEAAHPGIEVVISTSTDTGADVAAGLFPDHRIVRFPVDLSWAVRRFLRCVRPDIVLLVELEVWPNFLRACNRAGCPVAVINGRITEISHGGYLLFRKLLPQFNRISFFCVQLPEYAERFSELGVESERMMITGNVKVDGLRLGPVDPGEELRRLLGPREGQHVVVAGSTHPPEETYVAEAWRDSAAAARLILVPRHPHRCADVAAALTTKGFAVQRLSRLRSGEEPSDPSQVVIVDTIGELERVYGLADLVYVGGSLVPHGGQNVLEPAAQGKAVVFGPHVDNFTQEAGLLVRAGACRRVSDTADLGRAFAELLSSPAQRDKMGRAGMEAVASQRGATKKTLEALNALALDRLTGESPSP